MRCLLLILGLVALARAQGPAGWASLISARADANEMRLASIRTRLEAIGTKLREVGGGISTNQLAARVRKLTGNGCGDVEFQCGGDAPQCVSNLLVCDGSPDCRNGADEDGVCQNPVSDGSSWVGVAYWSSCNSVGQSNVRLIVNSATTVNFYTAQVKLQVTMINEQNGKYRMETTTGTYVYGKRRLIVQPTASMHLGAFCDFDGVNLNRCEGKILSDRQNECATIAFVRK